MDDPLPLLPPRAPKSHKGNYGRAVLIGGSLGMSGAITLAGVAALRGGAGRVLLAVPDECEIQIAAYEPSYMVRGLPTKDGVLARAAAFHRGEGGPEAARYLNVMPAMIA